MAKVFASKKACAENPLKTSAPLGAALAFLGVEGAVPLFHGSQGCTAFALVLAVRHFRESIPLQTTALDEVATVLGGADHLEEALITLRTRMKPKFIGVASTALVETRGEDFVGDLRGILERRAELADTAVVFASTPDFEGALEDGWSKATTAIVDSLVEPRVEPPAARPRVNLLPGVHQTAGDVEELRGLIEAFGIEVTILPDVSGSLDGHVPDAYVGTSMGGTSLRDIRRLGASVHTIAMGEHMRAPAQALAERAGVPYTVFASLTGLAESDSLVDLLARISGNAAPTWLRRQRSRLLDALLDGHFCFSGKRIALASDPDLLYALATLFHTLGAEVVCAISSTKNSPLLERIHCETVQIGDLADLEAGAAAKKAELLVTHSHGRRAAQRLGLPLFRAGFPIFDRLGAQHRCSVGYRGTLMLIHELANVLMGELHEPHPEDFARSEERSGRPGAAPEIVPHA